MNTAFRKRLFGTRPWPRRHPVFLKGPRPRGSRVLQACAWILLALAGLAHRAEARESGLFLSWQAPHGFPRANDQLATACGDTTRADTLYLSFQLDRPTPFVRAMDAVVFFHPQPGDSLGPFWFFKSGWPNGGGMWIDFAPYVDLIGTSPWITTGSATVSYDHRSGRGRLDLSYVLPEGKTAGLDPGVRYTFARVRILEHRSSLAGCPQPVCIEWGGARLAFETGREMEVPLTGSRFVGWNDPNGAACQRAHQDTRVRPWLRPPKGVPGR